MKLLKWTALLLAMAASFFPALPAAAQSTATYTVTFQSTWSATTHPQDFPSNPHFSGLIGATHDSTVVFWAEDALASPGIQNMAETGSKSPLNSEVEAAIDQGTAEAVLSGGGIGRSPGEVSLTFTLSETYPLVTLVSMVAPSPDWFVGVTGLSLWEDGAWVEEKVIDLYAHDAGTDSGTTYAAPNQATDPPQPIARLETAPFLVNGDVPPVGTFTFTLDRVDTPTSVEDDLPELPAAHVLSAAFPNPFRQQAAFTLTVGQTQAVRIDLYDLTGRRVKTLFDGVLQAGTPRRVSIEPGDLPSGVYVYRAVGQDFVDSRAVVLMR